MKLTDLLDRLISEKRIELNGIDISTHNEDADTQEITYTITFLTDLEIENMKHSFKPGQYRSEY